MVLRFPSRDAAVPFSVSGVLWVCLRLSPSPQGELGTPHINRSGIALLCDVIGGNEIQLSQWVSELQRVEQ